MEEQTRQGQQAGRERVAHGMAARRCNPRLNKKTDVFQFNKKTSVQRGHELS